jgi:hypothetical protein
MIITLYYISVLYFNMLESFVSVVGEGALAAGLGISTVALELCILAGSAIGNFIATMIPFWNKETEFAEFDISIIFNKKFLGTAVITFIGSFIVTSAMYSQIIQNVVDQQPITIVAAFIQAALIGGVANWRLNKAVPKPNGEAENLLEQKKEDAIIQKHEIEKKIVVDDGKTPTEV